MATPFSGNGFVGTGNAVSLLANSSIIFAGNTTLRANGTATAFFDNVVSITPSDPANFTVLFGCANAAHAAVLGAGLGQKNVVGGVWTISPGEIATAMGLGNAAAFTANGIRPDAGNIYVGSLNAGQTYTVSGF